MRHIHPLTLRGLALAALLGSGLAACGGGDPAPVESPAATEVPASAGHSVAAFVGHLRGMAPDDTRDPLGTDAILAPPTSETDDPLPLE